MPTRERWQPLRGGLMNLYYFDDLRLIYEDGRLLLRGNNGTGKSRILALQLPFLLDGEILPSRVEPDGDPSKRIEWHLLLDRYDDRVGYTWLEFGRRDEDGTAHFITLGCGMKAVKGKGAPTRWYFVTEQRVDEELCLTNKARIPLKRAALQDAIAQRGRVLDKAAEYRAAVDHALFQLGEQRYGALIDLLIQLRRPQLSRKLDAKLLSDALSQALPPLSRQTLADVAEAFRGLESDRAALERERSALSSTNEFTRVYRRYVQIATRRRAELLRKRHSNYEHAMRSLREAEVDLEDAQEALAALEVELAEAESERRRSEAARRELEGDPAQRDARRLQDAEEQARRASEELARAKERVQRAEEQLERERRAVTKAQRRREEARQALAEVRADVDETAAGLGLGGLLDGDDRVRVRRRVDDRERHAKHLQQRAECCAERRETHAQAVQQCNHAHVELERATALRTEAQSQRDRLLVELEAALEAWLDGLALLELANPDALFEALVDWSEHGEGEGPIAPLVRSAHARVIAAESMREAQLDQDRQIARDRRRELEAEREQLSAGVHRPPQPPAWRDEEARARRPGAPLWMLCDFRDDIDADERAAFEAALEAAGLLDAWITPDGRVLAGQQADACLQPGEPVARSLAAILSPSLDSSTEVEEAVVSRLLASIGAAPGEGRAWVAADGRFALAPLRGWAHKERAEHVGHVAREEARRRRLEALAIEISAIDEQLEDIERSIEMCGERKGRAQAEYEAAPLGADLRDGVRELTAAEREQHRRSQALRDANEVQARAEEALRAAEAELKRDAEELGLTPWVDDLRGLDRALERLRRALADAWRAKDHFDELDEALRERRSAEDLAEQSLREEQERREGAEVLVDQASARHLALRETVGAKVEELQRKLDELRRAGEAAERRQRELRKREREASQQQGAAGNAVEERRALLVERERERDEAIAQLQALARTGVWVNFDERWRERDLDMDWSATAAVDVARDLEKRLREVEAGQASWDRVTSTLHRAIQELSNALLTHGWTPATTQAAGVLVVTVTYQGQALDPSALAQSLAEGVQQRERILDEREREILEKHLIVEVARHLHDRLHGGERLVTKMNEEIKSRPLSTGMRFRFRWVPREEPELAQVRKRLLAAEGVWSKADREAIGRFLQQRIQDERARAEIGTWQEHLERALDYRDWHEFQIERQQNKRWQRLTRRTYGTGSGGEKAIALTLPQVAAAAAHYSSASSLAPRLILMDEAFVGVDADMRAKCMGLLAAFELDFVMTSEREWGCYDTLPALAIYQLVTRPGVAAVHDTRWVWRGGKLDREAPADEV